MSDNFFERAYHGEDIEVDSIADLTIPVCKMCNKPMGVETSIGIIMKSCYIGGDICHDCIVAHCCSTNCLACTIGNYPNCKHLERKKYYMTPEED